LPDLKAKDSDWTEFPSKGMRNKPNASYAADSQILIRESAANKLTNHFKQG
jgi:hypothetical protein